MKNLLKCILILFLTTPSYCYDFSEPGTDEFLVLNHIEKEVLQNSLSSEKAGEMAKNSGLLLEANAIQSTFDRNGRGDLPLVGGFWWGCCLGVIGLLVVYIITDNDRSQVKKALFGCIISTILFSLGGIFNVFNL